eukprot:9146800-Ditylum_brightwellii.AAC.1
MASFAFGSATTYLKICCSLLGDDQWHNEASLSLDIFTTLAKAEFCNGNVTEVGKYVDKILNQNLPIKEKADAFCVKISSCIFLEGEFANGMDVGLKALLLLGVEFPKKITKLTHAREIIKTKYMLKGLCIDGLSHHPTMEDENRLIAMNIMDRLTLSAYAANPYLFVLIVLKMVQWSVSYGVSKYSSMAFVCYGLLLCGVMCDIEGGDKFAKA